MDIFSIGFTQKTAATFFGILRRAGIKRLIDVRLNNVSQLAGFSKRDDLAYFLKEICQAEFIHEPLLAPTQAMKPLRHSCTSRVLPRCGAERGGPGVVICMDDFDTLNLMPRPRKRWAPYTRLRRQSTPAPCL